MISHHRHCLICLSVFFLLTEGFLHSRERKDTLFVKDLQVPILIERFDNILFQMRLDKKEDGVLNSITLEFDEAASLGNILGVKLYYGGTESRTGRKDAYAPTDYLSPHDPASALRANASYSILLEEVKSPDKTVVFNIEKALFPGINYFWISLEPDHENATLSDKFSGKITEAFIDGYRAEISTDRPECGPVIHRTGIGVRHAGDDGSAAYRIPGLVTTKYGTLIASYDIRYNSSRDLQEHIDIGISRSTDGGRTWEKMIKAISFGEKGGLPAAQNGAGDAALLADDVTGDVLLASIWAHGMGRGVSWWSTMPGMDPEHTAQLVLARSRDDGQTWDEPVLLTPGLKDENWAFFFDGPGRGITTSDGKLVFAMQYTLPDVGRTPFAGIIWSDDHGATWHKSTGAIINTTEAQVAELQDGTLMLNMRDNRGGSRSVATTADMGLTWTEHPSSRSALPEPVCMASLISVRAEDNVTGKHLLLFSNPDKTDSRSHITIKASTDDGLTWRDSNKLLLDEGESWGYSCLTMIDGETVGILYESSAAHLVFQAIPLKDILHF